MTLPQTREGSPKPVQMTWAAYALHTVSAMLLGALLLAVLR